MNSPKYLFVISQITVFLAICVLVVILLFAFYPLKPLVVESPLPVLNSEIHPGDSLKVNMTFCKYIDKPATITRRLVNDISYNLPENIISNPVGCRSEIVTSTVIPKEIPPGLYVLKYTATYQLNFLKSITVRYETVPFKVI